MTEYMSSLYEAVFVFRQDITVSEVNKNIEQLMQVVKAGSGNILKHEYWGLRSLAYPIKKNKKGHYVMLVLDATKQILDELKHKIKLSEDVIRNQMVSIKSFDGKDSVMLSFKEKDKG
jgi:small subunit ribosomal protein S6